MSKNGDNQNYLSLKDKNQKLIKTEKRLINEGIIFKSRLISNKKGNKKIIERNKNQTSKNSYKNFSIRLTEKNNKKKDNNILNNNISDNSKRGKKISFSKNINESSKERIKKNNSNKTNFNYKLSENNNNKSMNIIKPKNHKRYKTNSNKSFLNYNVKDKSRVNSGNVSPRTSCFNIENGFISPKERTKDNINRVIDNIDKFDIQKFNYKKGNKIAVNKIFDKDINNGINETSNIIINKGNTEKNNDINSNEEHKNSKKQKKIKNIPINKRKNKSKECLIERNDIFNYCKQMTSLALSKEIDNNFNGKNINGLKFEQILRVDNLQEKNVNHNNKSTSHKKFNSIKRRIKDSIPLSPQYSLKELDLQIKNDLWKFRHSNNSKISSLKHYICNNNNISKNKKSNFENINMSCRNNFYVFKENSIPKLNSQIIEIKNNNIIDYVKTEVSNDIKSNKEIIFNINENKNDKTDIKNELYENGNEEIYYSNTNLFTEKDKGYTFDNKIEKDNTESSIKFCHNSINNNIFDNNISINCINNMNRYPYSPQNNVFTKKRIGCVNMKVNNYKNVDNDDNKENKALNKQNSNNIKNINLSSNINIIKENKIDEKKIIFRNKNDKQYINNSSSYGGNYMELAKLCANQEKIISDLVKNVQKLNNQICDKDLCINELNSQIYSIKYDLLNTLQKTSNNQ